MDIIIKPADKGKAVVVLDTEDYKKECYRQINDPKFYKQIKKDNTHEIEERIRRRLKQMIIDDEIDQQAYNYLLPRRSRPARFYILPKIHKNKQNPPGRPIVSANSHPTDNISQFVDSHLHTLKNLNKEPVNYWSFYVSEDTNDSTFKPKSIKPFKFHVVTLYITTQRKILTDLSL